jgi:hypothetical protein
VNILGRFHLMKKLNERVDQVSAEEAQELNRESRGEENSSTRGGGC